MTSSTRHISEVDLADDEHVRDLLDCLPNPTGQTLLGCLFCEGDVALPTFPLVEECPAVVSVAEAARMVSTLAAACASLADDPAVLIVWKRRGDSAPTDDDIAWLRAAPGACADQGVRLLGVWLVAGSAAPLRLDAPLPA